ncbi:hypothetical protein ABE10_01690, partial [Bacillus toyonensis]|nr:hypothetical protein [Bacillus toyonensis]
VLVRGVEVLHQQGEGLLVGGSEEVVATLAILQAEQQIAVLLPAARRFVCLPGHERREMNLLRAGGGHLLPDDFLDPGFDPQTQRKPGEDAGGLAADVPRPDQQPV